ncbi:hypothetical protein GCM10022403_009500 [Streptomyces coacervatus]|uniref:Orc1-like AAA ATPase domain-containing protein n=1 Tax=Streptomyces coacervatus TaxID=647381 RepID=A0ABP7GX12_9ACTN
MSFLHTTAERKAAGNAVITGRPIADALRGSHGPGIVVLSGLGGVGKTQVVAQWVDGTEELPACEQRDGFGQLWFVFCRCLHCSPPSYGPSLTC